MWKKFLYSIASLHLILTAAVAAQSISLNGNFQRIDFDIGQQCRAAYNSPIPDCSAADFQNNSPCSDACILSLKKLQVTLNTVCGVRVDGRTLLGNAFQGKLVQALCNTAVASTSAEASTIAPVLSKSTLEAATTEEAATTAPVLSKSTSEAAKTTSSARSSSARSETTSSDISSSTTATSLHLGIGDSDPTPTSTVAVIATATVVPSSTSFNQVAQPTGLSRQQHQIDANRDSGGGSPFDIVAVDRSSGATQSFSSSMSLLMGLLFGAVVLVR